MENNDVLKAVTALDPNDVSVFVSVVDELDNEPVVKPVVHIRMNKATYEALVKQ